MAKDDGFHMSPLDVSREFDPLLAPDVGHSSFTSANQLCTLSPELFAATPESHRLMNDSLSTLSPPR